MRADGELTREQFQKLYAQTTTELDALKTQQNSVPDSAEEEVSFDLNKIKKGFLRWWTLRHLVFLKN